MPSVSLFYNVTHLENATLHQHSSTELSSFLWRNGLENRLSGKTHHVLKFNNFPSVVLYRCSHLYQIAPDKPWIHLCRTTPVDST